MASRLNKYACAKVDKGDHLAEDGESLLGTLMGSYKNISVI